MKDKKNDAAATDHDSFLASIFFYKDCYFESYFTGYAFFIQKGVKCQIQNLMKGEFRKSYMNDLRKFFQRSSYHMYVINPSHFKNFACCSTS